ncbi:hypothetical protein C0993_008381 [Termitomyces sp. T159_Od127]|nr:hypothetical protein C0993_008381 [Termitomyces sp. T159_Od127]
MEPEDTPETFDISQNPLFDITIHEETPERAILTFEASAEADLSVSIQQESVTPRPLQFDDTSTLKWRASNLEHSGQAAMINCDNWEEDLDETIMQAKPEISFWDVLRDQVKEDIKKKHKTLLLSQLYQITTLKLQIYGSKVMVKWMQAFKLLNNGQK